MPEMSHILINSMSRSGGSLIARMLDGHPELLVMPLEMKYSPLKVAWPDLRDTGGDFSEIAKRFDLVGTFAKFSKGGRLTKDLYGRKGIDLDWDKFTADIKAGLEDREINLKTVTDAVTSAFFRAWDSGAHLKDVVTPKYLVNHLSMMCLAYPGTFFEAYPGGYAVQVVREPRSWYASVKKVFEIPDKDPVFAPYALYLWAETSIRALVYAKFFKGRYLLVRYEDLVLDPEGSMRALCGRLGIEFEPALTRPTIGGDPWRGNSPYGPQDNVSAAPTTRWKEILTSEEVKYIEENFGDLARVLGYGDELGRVDFRADRAAMPALDCVFHLDFATERDLLLEETRRMSMITYQVYNRNVLRSVGGRYKKRSGLLGPAMSFIKKRSG